MDMTVYTAQKSAGVVTLVKLGPDTVGVVSPKFDENTASVEQFNLKLLDDGIAQQQVLLAQMTQLRADVAAVLAGK